MQSCSKMRRGVQSSQSLYARFSVPEISSLMTLTPVLCTVSGGKIVADSRTFFLIRHQTLLCTLLVRITVLDQRSGRASSPRLAPVPLYTYVYSLNVSINVITSLLTTAPMSPLSCVYHMMWVTSMMVILTAFALAWRQYCCPLWTRSWPPPSSPGRHRRRCHSPYPWAWGSA
jgi:hypothetical protein